MELELNKSYEFEVVDICTSANGMDYILVLGPDDKTYYVKNIIKYQYNSIPNTITGIVVGYNHNGKAMIWQDECSVLQEHYILGHFYAFKIVDKTSDKNDKDYYVLEDDFSFQRWYTNEDIEIGDEIILEAKSFSNQGYINYARHQEPNWSQLVKPQSTSTITATPIPPITGPVFNGGEESERIEYKTSIVFPPNKENEAEINTQIFNIVKELAGFMNAQGGTLYIGIHDKTKQVVGIEKDLPHLCEGDSPYASSYTADLDHYQLKIRDSVVYYCSSMAGSLMKISFPQQDGITYCQIDVAPAKIPVWVRGNQLFQRQGNQTQMLRGESLTQFVLNRMARDLFVRAGQSAPVDDMRDLIQTSIKSAINNRRWDVAAPVAQTQGEPKYWIVWYSDGTWKKQKNKSSEPNIFKQLPVAENTVDLVLAFCHKSGTVNKVILSDFVKKTKLGIINKDGLNPKEAPLDIFICHTSWLVAVHSADQGGTEYVKLHHLTDFNPTNSGKNVGPCIIPKSKGHVLQYKLVSPEQAASLKSLVFSKKDTSRSFGLDWNNVTIQKELGILKSISC